MIETNGARFAHDRSGHYESWFLRGNHPTRPLAFWIRYTLFERRKGEAIGERWAIVFDGEKDEITAGKDEIDIRECSFARQGLDVKIGPATLQPNAAQGSAGTLSWDLEWAGGQSPLLFLPERFYSGGFPKAKALVPAPLCSWSGHIEVAGERYDLEGWPGSQNHNWGSQHTDQYAWGQVAGFDDAPDAFLECSTARVKIGPLWTPWLSLMVLRLDGQTYALNGMRRALRAKGRYADFQWSLRSKTKEVELEARISAPASRFVGLRYFNPPGNDKVCLNSKLASCELRIRRGGEERVLRSAHRAAFEMLTDSGHPDVPIVA